MMDAEPENKRSSYERSFASEIMNAALDCIVVADDAGRIVNFNPAAEATFGWTEAEAVGRLLEETIIPPDHREGHRRGMARLRDNNERLTKRRIEIEGLRRDGSIFPVELALSDIDDDGRRLYVAFLRDLTQQKAVAAEREQVMARFEAFFHHAPATMYIRDLDGKLSLINDWVMRAYGLQPSLAHGMDISQFRPESEDRAQAQIARALETGEPQVDEYEYVLPSGRRTGHCTVFPIRDPGGSVRHIGGMVIDVTEERRAQKELSNARATLESFIEHVPIPFSLIETDALGGVRLALLNPAFQQYYGEASARLLSGDVSELASFWPEWDEKVLPLNRQVMTSGQLTTIETLFKHQDGRLRQLQLSAFPVSDEIGGKHLIGVAAVDLTDFHENQANIVKAKEAAHQSEKLAALGQMIAGVAHELNNPLAVVLGRAELLEEQLANSPHLPMVQKLSAAAERCARIVKAFLAMARQSGPKRTRTDLNGLIAIALDLTEHVLRSARIDLDLQVSPTLPAVLVDDDQIVQVLINLILNAQQAMEATDGEHKLTISTYLDPSGTEVILEVSDNGPGVPLDHVPRLFEPFFSTKEVGQGTGLGLSVCKGIVDAHNGTIEHDNVAGGGALFRVTLPIYEAARSPLTAEDTNLSISADRDPKAMIKGNVLIVDDESDVAALLTDCLEPLSFSCTTASNASDALACLAERQDFDIIFSDVRMPGLDGFELFDRVQERWPRLADRFVFISGDVLHSDLQEKVGRTQRPIIEKPFSAQAIRQICLDVVQSNESLS